MKITALVVALVLTAGVAFAQSDTLNLERKIELPKVELQKPKSTIDKEFIGVGAYLIAMTIFDVETTFAAIRNSGGTEANPVMKPFVKNGRVATYAFTLAVDALVLYIAYEIKGSKDKKLQKMWWIGPMIVGTGHGIAGGLNCRYVF